MHFEGLPVILIDEASLDEVLRTPFGHAEDSPELHAANCREVIDVLRCKLLIHWSEDLFSGDFFISLDIPYDNMLAIEIANEAMLNPQLLSDVHQIIASRQEDYCVDVCDSWGYLKNADGSDYAHFNILIERSRILIYSADQAVLSRIGVVGE